MRMQKFEARINVEIDYEKNRAVLVIKEEGVSEPSKIMLNADVAFSVGRTLEAYSLMLKQNEREKK